VIVIESDEDESEREIETDTTRTQNEDELQMMDNPTCNTLLFVHLNSGPNLYVRN
jgi:hypothetical protein